MFNLSIYIYIYMYTYTYMCVYIYIYILGSSFPWWGHGGAASLRCSGPSNKPIHNQQHKHTKEPITIHMT